MSAQPFVVTPKDYDSALNVLGIRVTVLASNEATLGYEITRQEFRRVGAWSAKAQRNVELGWLRGRLAPDFKTIADFRRDNRRGHPKVCSKFVELSRLLGLFGDVVIAIDSSKFKAVNNLDKNITPHKF
jgi:hypothetical protein